MSTYPAVCVGFQKVEGIAVTDEYHVACLICDDGVGMCGGIVKKLMDYFFGVLRWICLLRGKGS